MKNNMNPFSNALSAYHAGDHSVSFVLKRDDGFEEKMSASVFFLDKEFSTLEMNALELCKGHVLDIGAGTGRHSLELIKRGFSVTALDISPKLEKIMSQKGQSSDSSEGSVLGFKEKLILFHSESSKRTACDWLGVPVSSALKRG